MDAKNFIIADDLVKILNHLEQKEKCKITITDLGRTIQEHIATYKKIHGAAWMEHITWDSRHLPCWKTSKLRAVDFKCSVDGKYLSGKQIKILILKVANELKIKVGLGVGSVFVHLDVDREIYTEWSYNY